MINFYEETIRQLNVHGKTEEDIRWIGIYNEEWHGDDKYFNMTGITLKDLFSFEYDNGWGSEEIDINLKVVGDDWWLERHEYDGSEWWEFKELPKKPEKVADYIQVTSDYRS